MEHPVIPFKLYGRDHDLSQLLETFERISSGHGEVLLVPGSSGVGKTALVQELRIPIQDRNGFYTSGKFDQYQQNIPYSAFRQALTELCQKLLSGDIQYRAQLKDDILKSIGNMGQVLVDLVPYFESFLGPQPLLENINPQEALHRFIDLFRNFLSVICVPEHPMVIFLDDWQWADAASFELLKQLEVGISLRYFLVIASYRVEEVNIGHPLISSINDLKGRGVPIEVLQVENITDADIRELLKDTLKPEIENIDELASIIYNKTQGNPFFVKSLLNYLLEFKIKWSENGRNCWQWSINETESADLPENVMDLFVLKLQRLDTVSRNLFSTAACLGNRFDIRMLSIISECDPLECISLLFSEQAQGLLFPLNGDQGFTQQVNQHDPIMCAFLHDRVQQAAFSFISTNDLPELKLKIGRLLLKSLSPERLSESLFDVVSALNAGYELVRLTAEKFKIVELNIAAARKSYAAAAYRSALAFYRAANRFLEVSDFNLYMWDDHHELTMSLFQERAECEFLEGDRNWAEQCIQEAVKHSVTAIEAADALNILIVQFTLLSRYQEAIKAGRQALITLGIILPEEDYEAFRDQEIEHIRKEIGTRSVTSLFELPIMQDPEMLMASKILITMGPPCYRSHQRLWSVIVPKVVSLTLRYGNIPQVGYSHTAFGGLLGWVDDDYKTAKEFGILATQLMTKTFHSPSEQSVFYLMHGSSIRHWFSHLRLGTQDYRDAYEIGLLSGNLQYAAYAFGHNMYCRFYQGVALEGLINESERSLEFSKIRMNQWAIDLLEGGLNIFNGLTLEDNSENKDDARTEAEYLKRVDNHSNIQVTCIYKILKTFSLLLADNYNDALLLSDNTKPFLYTVGSQGLLPWPEYVFSRLLILTMLYPAADDRQQILWRSELDEILNKLRIWSDNCSDNFEHKYLLAAAELARIDGRSIEAIQLYDKAIEAARSGNFLQWEGMANERAYHFWFELGNDHFAFVYWKQAYVCYKQWGANSKINTMEKKYRIYLREKLPAGNVTEKRLAIEETKIKNELIESQIMQIRNFANQIQQSKSNIEVVHQADELAHAMQRLRVEISERKKIEAEINLKNEQLTKLNAEKIKFFSIISHDLRGPFSSFLGLTEIMAKELSSLTMTEIQDIAERMMNSVTSLYSLLENLLQWSQINQGLILFRPEELNLLSVFTDTIALVMESAQNKKIKITFDIQEDVTVFADKNILQTIIRNLVSNAIKFTPRGGKIKLSANTGADNSVEIAVWDSGIGMNQEMIENLFQVGHQTNRTGTENEPSTGLGLLLCKEFVEKHNGNLRVESIEGKGSTFYFNLPYKAE
jgi:predicted ATPase/signal transduction histidine kinase